MENIVIVWCVILLYFPLLHCCCTNSLTLTILHTNDIHSRLLEVDSNGLACAPMERARGECFGGFSRIHYKVKEIRQTHTNVAYLSAGDYFQGTPWYTLYKWKQMATFVNKFNHTAMTLGNHEFDDGVAGVVPFLEEVTFPVISANIDASQEPRVSAHLSKSVVVEYDGKRVGIIGYTTLETIPLDRIGMLVFEDIFEAVRIEAEKLTQSGVKIIIALGHAGYDIDLKVAREVPHIDVVVGGHTNTFLYTGSPLPSVEQPEGEYPTIVNVNGRTVLVVQAYEFGKYLGYLNVTFDSTGEVEYWAGNPILLDSSVPKDPKMEEDIMLLRTKFPKWMWRTVGETRIFLEGLKLCRKDECGLGDVVADSLVAVANRDLGWNVSLGMMTGGNLRASVPAYHPIRMDDILTVFPFRDTVTLVELQGRDIRAMFEFSVTDLKSTGLGHSGGFLQVSGFRVTYDLRNARGQRLLHLLVPSGNSTIGVQGVYKEVEDELVYRVAMPVYLVRGGDGYDMITPKAISVSYSDIQVSAAIAQYIKAYSPITEEMISRRQVLLL